MKKFLSVFLAVVMLISVFSASFTVFAYTGISDEYDEELDDWVLHYYKDDVIQKGWIKVVQTDGDTTYTDWYYADPTTGVLAEGWKTINGKTYYFWPEMCTGMCYIGEDPYYFNPLGTADEGALRKNGWIKDVDSYTWIDDEGEEHVDTWTDWYYAGPDGKLYTGWQQINNVWYWFYSDGQMVYDCVYEINEKSYYFDENGAMRTGWIKEVESYTWYDDDDQPHYESYINWYYADANGVLAQGWKTIDGKTYYFYDGGELATGIVEIDGKYYLIDEDKGLLKNSWYRHYDSWFRTDANGALVTGWKQYGGKWYYFSEDDWYPYMYSGGVYTINDKQYYFGSDGVLGIGWIKTGSDDYYDNRVYYANSDGVLQTGWQTIGGKKYYFYDNDSWSGPYMATGMCDIDDKDYLFGDDGAWCNTVGWVCVQNTWYYVTDKNGTLFEGWKQLGGKWYYFSPGMYYGGSNRIYNEKTHKDEPFVFKRDGELVTKVGWYQSFYDEYYYYGSSGNSGIWYYVYNTNGNLETGWKQHGGKWYYFGSNGIMYAGGARTVYNSKTEKDDAYLFADNGTLVTKTGWNSYTVETYWGETYTNWVFVTSDDSKLETGWNKHGNNWYYFSESGVMLSGGPCYVYNENSESGDYYLFDANGALVTKTGWNSYTYTSEYGDTETKWVYVTSDDSKLRTGWMTSGGKKYYLDGNGMVANGSYELYDESTDTDALFVFESNGVLTSKTGWVSVTNTFGGKKYTDWYYVEANGIAKTGWFKYNNKWYYLDDNSGRMLQSEVDNLYDTDDCWHWYGFDANGCLITKAGWLSNPRESSYYGYGESGTSTWYYIDTTGDVFTDGWKQLGGKWYYFNTWNGEMAANGIFSTYDYETGKNAKYAFDSNGLIKQKAGWFEMKYHEGPYSYSYWFYLNADGTPKTDWQSIGGKWYYFGSWGEMYTGWSLIKGHWYYFGDNGAMVTGKQTIDGVSYTFGSDGICKNP